MATFILSIAVIILLIALAIGSGTKRKYRIIIANQRETIDNNNETIYAYKSILTNGVALPTEILKTIDFATWYSGMDREKVERAYSKYLSENPKSV